MRWECNASWRWRRSDDNSDWLMWKSENSWFGFVNQEDVDREWQLAWRRCAGVALRRGVAIVKSRDVLFIVWRPLSGRCPAVGLFVRDTHRLIGSSDSN